MLIKHYKWLFFSMNKLLSTIKVKNFGTLNEVQSDCVW